MAARYTSNSLPDDANDDDDDYVDYIGGHRVGEESVDQALV